MAQAQGNTMDFDQVLHWFLHTVSGSAILSTIFGLTPVLFAVPACAYYCLLLSRDPTVQGWRHKRRQHKINKLKMALKELEAADEQGNPK